MRWGVLCAAALAVVGSAGMFSLNAPFAQVLMANELADDDNGAMVAGMLQSVIFVAFPFGTVMSNQLFSSFTPALTLRENFIEDAVSFRWTVAYSYLVAYTFSFASLALLPLAPAQKKQAQARKQEPGLHLRTSWL